METVNPAMQATLDAAALTVMAARGQITGASVDGPFAFDNAINFDSARIKEIVSPVAGQADILVVPISKPVMLAKQLIYLAGADAAGLVLGARAPIILTSRSDSLKVRLASSRSPSWSPRAARPVWSQHDRLYAADLQSRLFDDQTRPVCHRSDAHAASGEAYRSAPQPPDAPYRRGSNDRRHSAQAAVTGDLREVIEETLGWLGSHFSTGALAAVGHRVVHGGDRFAGPEAITDDTLDAIEALIQLAPLHQPQSVRLIQGNPPSLPGPCRRSPPSIRPFTAARATSCGALPCRARSLTKVSSAMASTACRTSTSPRGSQQVAPAIADAPRVVVAHLGSGASLCAHFENGISRDTSMGFSTLDGIPMATRCGALDPGVLIHLMKERRLSIEEIEDMLYHRSGLLGISGISADSRDLIASEAPEAREALNLLTLRIARETAALTTTLHGLDAVVFTAGIGEHHPRSAKRGLPASFLARGHARPGRNPQNATRIAASGQHHYRPRHSDRRRAGHRGRNLFRSPAKETIR